MFRKFLKLSTLLIIAMTAGFFVSCADTEDETYVYYTVSFDSDGGTSIEPVKVMSGESLGFSMPQPQKTGWNFEGWYDTEGVKITKYSSITKNLTLKAKWQVVVNFYYGKDYTNESQKFVDKNSEITTSEIDSYEDAGKKYSFYFWTTDNTATESDKESKSFDLANGSDISPLNLYAIYTSKNIWTVVFKNEDETIKTVKVEESGKVEKPSDPYRTSCHFSYWYENDYKTEYDFNTSVTSDLTLNAKWNVRIQCIDTLTNGTIKVDNFMAANITAKDCSDFSATYLKNGENEEKDLSLTFDETHSGEKWYSYFNFEPFSSDVTATYTVTLTNGKETVSENITIEYLNAPQNIVATAGDSMVSLAWEKITSATSYEVSYYKSSEPAPVKTQSVYLNSAKIKGLENGVEYSFTVKPKSGTAASEVSSPVTSTPVITKKTSDVLMIMYMDGDNDLNDPIYLDMNEVEYGLYKIEGNSSFKSINVVALWDGWAGSSTKDPVLNHSGSFIYELGKDTSNDTTYLTSGGCVLSSYTKDLSYTAGAGTSTPWLASGEVDMSSKNTLKNFLEWVQARYEADDVILQFSNHGGGPRSYKASSVTLPNGMSYHIPGTGDRRAMCWDDASGENTFLKTSDVSSVLKECGYSSNKLSMIIEDVCLGGSIEEAYQFKDYANYLLASPNNVPGLGLDYANLIQSFSKDATMEAVGKSIIDCYEIDYKKSTEEWNTWVSDNKDALQDSYGIDTENLTVNDKILMSILNTGCTTLTLVDLSKMDALRSEIDAFASVIINNYDTKTFDGMYYDTVTGKYTKTANENTQPVRYGEVLRADLLTYDGNNIFRYMGTFSWLYDSGFLFSRVLTLAGADGLSPWQELAAAAESVNTALKAVNAYAWRDGFKGIPLYEGKNTLSGLTISGGSVELMQTGGVSYPVREKYPSWYQTELDFGKDCKWGELLYKVFSE